MKTALQSLLCRSSASLQILCRIARIFRVSTDELLGFALKDEEE